MHRPVGLALVMCLGLGIACGDDGTGRIDVEIVYPSDTAENITGTLHLWVLGPSSGEDAATCALLVGKEADPYDLEFSRFADRVFLQPDEPNVFADDLPKKAVFVYVEGVDFIGNTHLAGCVEASVGGGAVTVTVEMTTPGTFDCSDPETENDAPCDDGDLCTVNESCSGSSCGDGVARNCDFLADQCNAASCDSETGCVATPVPNNVDCDDSKFCTTGDVCTDGVCDGAPTDCSAVENGCRIGTCDEAFNQCVGVPVADTTPCDLFCTVGGTCSAGTCINGGARNCNAVADQCNNPGCDEDADACVPIPLTGPLCDDSDVCTTNESCSNGVCVGVNDFDGDGFTAVGCNVGTATDCDDTDFFVNTTITEGPLGNATCSDLKDNDCDGDVDAADSGCQ